jgi:hypothetical protein
MSGEGSGNRDQESKENDGEVPPVKSSGAGSAGRWNRFAGPVLILLAAAVAVAPQLIRGNSCGHDFDFHLVSWFDCLNSWRHGIPYPHWTPSANFGAGEPRFVFYPPLTWMLGAALGLVLPWQLVPIALTWVLLAGTGLATRGLGRQALSEGASTLAGCAAIFSGYSLFCAYERSAFGELTGGFWIPLLLLLILRDRKRSGPVLRRALDGSTFLLALVVAGAWLSNVPVGIMASYLLAAVALAVALVARSWAPVLRATIAAVLGIGLSAIYLVPAAWEQRWIDVRQATGDPGEMIENSWLFGRHANPVLALHDEELRRVSIIAVVMIVLALAGILVGWLRGGRKRDGWSKTRQFRIPLALIPVAILLLQLPISLPVWNLLPRLRFLQFPWRWLVMLEAPMAIFVASAIWPSKQAQDVGRRWWHVAVVSISAAVFLGATVLSGTIFFQVCDDEDAVRPMVDAYRSGAGFVGTDEYAPPGADNTMVATGLPFGCLVSDPTILLGKAADGGAPAWDTTQGTCDATIGEAAKSGSPEHLRIDAVIPHAGFLILRLRNYPAWRLSFKGGLAAVVPARDDGLMAVPVQQGQLALTADWATTPDAIAGRWISALSIVLITALCLLERKLSRPRVE